MFSSWEVVLLNKKEGKSHTGISSFHLKDFPYSVGLAI